MTPRSLTPRAPLLWLLVPWCAGAALAHAGWIPVSQAACASAAFLGLALTWVFAWRMPAESRTSRILIAGAAAFALASAGALRTGQERARPADWDRLALPPREARLELRVETLFASRDPARVGGIARVVGADAWLADLLGQRIHFSATWPETRPVLVRGAGFSAIGLLSPLPFSPPTGSFERFLADQGVNFSFSRARLIGEPSPAGAWPRFCAATEARLERVLRAGLEKNPRLADLYVAMILGQKQELSPEQKDEFVRSGTMHLFAISGLHVAAIALAINSLLSLVRVPSRARFFASTALLWFFVQITGNDASALRAFWMITCLFGARQLRTPASGLSALAASALLALLVSPHQLFTAGFQLSYAIVAALLLYGVPLQEKWHEAWRPWANLPTDARGWRHRAVESGGRALLAALALGLASTLASTPATLGFFGLLAPGGFAVNLLLIPISSLVLFAGVGALLCGFIGLTPLVVLFNHAAALVLAAMEKIVALSLSVPGASWPAHCEPAWLATAASLALLALLAAGYALRWPRRLGGYWTPYVALGLFLGFGVVRTVPATASADGKEKAPGHARGWGK